MLKVPDGTLRILVQGGQRVRARATSRPPSPTWSPASRRRPTSSTQTPELEALLRNVQTTFSQIIEKVPYLPEELQLAVANLDDPAELAHMIAGALRMKTEERQELLEERDLAQAAAAALGAARARARAGRDREPDPVAGPVRDRQGPARVLPAPAAQGDPGGARRGRRDAGRGATSCASSSRRPTLPEARRASRPSASCSASSACRRSRPSTA